MKHLLDNLTLREVLLQDKSYIVPKKTTNHKTIKITLNRVYTKFDTYAIQRSLRTKKQRSDVKLKTQETGTLFYSLAGQILKIKRKHNLMDSSILFRNIIDLASFEMSVALFSPLLTSVSLSMRTTKRRSQYHLRLVAPVKSKVPFNYATKPTSVLIGEQDGDET